MKFKILSSGLVFTMLVGLSIDYRFSQGTMPFKIVVDEEYIYSIYAAIVTIAALSSTILTVVINSLNERYYGFYVKEIVNFKNEYIRVSRVVSISLISILLSTFLLAFGMINSMGALLFSIVLLIVSMTSYTWKFVSDENFCIDRVYEQIDEVIGIGNQKDIEEIFNRLFDSVNETIQESSLVSLDSHLELISKMIKNSEPTKEFAINLNRQIRKTFKQVNLKFGFLLAVDKVLDLYNFIGSDYSNFDRREILSGPLQQIKYLSENELASSSMVQIPNGLEYIETLNESDKIFVLFFYFKNVIQNEVISERVRRSLAGDLIRKITYFGWSSENEYDAIKQKTLIHIFQDFVLLNKDIREAEHILIQISETLYSEGYSESKKLIETIALLYLALYVYSEHEVETLSEKHRENLKNLINISRVDVHTSRISFKKVVESYHRQITEELWELSEDKYTKFDFLEYFPPQSGAKLMVWNQWTIIKFAMYNYILSPYEFENSPFNIIRSWSNDINKKNSLRVLLDLFDSKKQKLNLVASEDLRNLSDWIESKDIISEDYQKTIFNELNQLTKELEIESLSKLSQDIPKVDEINSQIQKQFREYKYYGYDEKIDFEDAPELNLRPFIEDVEYCNNSLYLSTKIRRYFERILNEDLVKVFPEVKLSFDKNGVKQLSEVLKEKNFTQTNYMFISDFTLKDEVRESEEYDDLSKVFKNIGFTNIPPINQKMFFQDNCLNYNFTVTNYIQEELTEEERAQFVERYKVGEDLYRLKNAYYNKSMAMDIMEKTHQKMIISFRYKTNFNENCGIRIGFDFNR